MQKKSSERKGTLKKERRHVLQAEWTTSSQESSGIKLTAPPFDGFFDGWCRWGPWISHWEIDIRGQVQCVLVSEDWYLVLGPACSCVGLGCCYSVPVISKSPQWAGHAQLLQPHCHPNLLLPSCVLILISVFHATRILFWKFFPIPVTSIILPILFSSTLSVLFHHLVPWSILILV